jgi:hypothetical protein
MQHFEHISVDNSCLEFSGDCIDRLTYSILNLEKAKGCLVNDGSELYKFLFISINNILKDLNAVKFTLVSSANIANTHPNK